MRITGLWRRTTSALAIIVATFAITLRAAPYTFTDSDLRDLPTSANGRTYRLYIGYPPSYFTQPTRKFPTLYFPDAYWDFSLLMPITGNLRVDYAIPEVLLVGIGYAGTAPDVNRLRTLDLTPGPDFSDPNGLSTGHAQEFLSVIENEIIPLIERDYHADPSYRVLAGNSFGGLFTTYAAFQRPGLFQGYIASSPSLQWRGHEMLTRETNFHQTHADFPARIYFGYASEDLPVIMESTPGFYRQFASHSYNGLAVAIREMEGERHSSTKAEAYTRGLRFVFSPIAPIPGTVATTARASLINISTRGVVTPDQPLIAGFVVQGLTPKRVLVRAGGPALTPLGVSGVLADPRLRVVDNAGVTTGENDDWPYDNIVVSAAQQAGVFAFSPGSKDAAIVLTLNPGAYTALVTGANATSGNALVEVYELP